MRFLVSWIQIPVQLCAHGVANLIQIYTHELKGNQFFEFHPTLIFFNVRIFFFYPGPVEVHISNPKNFW